MTDGRTMTYSEREREFTFAKNCQLAMCHLRPPVPPVVRRPLQCSRLKSKLQSIFVQNQIQRSAVKMRLRITFSLFYER